MYAIGSASGARTGTALGTSKSVSSSRTVEVGEARTSCGRYNEVLEAARKVVAPVQTHGEPTLRVAVVRTADAGGGPKAFDDDP